MTAQESQLVAHLVHELQGRHEEFRHRFSRQYPNLTEYDLRLCIMLKSNLATKEMATLLNITPDSVKKAKHRLRKKLALAPSDSWRFLETTASSFVSHRIGQLNQGDRKGSG